MIKHTARHHHIRKHLDKKLRNSIRLYLLISVILSVIVGYDIFIGMISFFYAGIGMIVGVFLGIFTARMYHLSWNEGAQKIVSQLDWLGGVIIGLYIIAAIFRNRIIELFVHGPVVGGISMAIVTGLMIGRVVGTRGKISQILKEQKVL